jgi:hypothetical protein
MGGAPGSHTVGVSASAGMGGVEIERANRAAGEAIQALQETLRELADEVALAEPDGGRIRSLVEKLRSLAAVPRIVLDTVTATLSLAKLANLI